MKNVAKKGIATIAMFSLAALTLIPAQGNAFTGKGKAKANSQEVSYETDLDYKNDSRLPWGIRIAPGIEKRVSNGKGLPFGIFKKLFNGNDDDDDNNVEEIRIVSRDIDVDMSTAVIIFKTNVETDGTLRYSTNSDLSNSTVIDLDLSEEHEVNIDNLEPDTTYYVKLFLSNEDDTDTLETPIRSFTTQDDDNVEITLSNIVLDPTDSALNVSFDTNVETKGVIKYSINSDLSGETEVDLDLSDSHDVEIDGLSANTKYYIKLELTTENEETTYESSIRSFTTDVNEDTEAPTLTFFHVFAVDTDSVYVIWISSEGTDAKVWVDTDSDVDTSVDPISEESDLKLFHVLKVEGLSLDTEYYIKASSSDESGNETFTDTKTFTTDAS